MPSQRQTEILDRFIWQPDDIKNELSPTTHSHTLSAPAPVKRKPGSRPRLIKINGLLAHQALNRIDPTRTTGLRNRWAAEMKRRFTALRRLIWRAIVDDDCFGLGPAYRMYQPTVHSNPCHDAQGRFCSTGGGGGSIWGKDQFSVQSERMDHKIQNASDQKLFIDSYLKDSEKNWLDGGREIKAVETIVDISRPSNSGYLNYIHSLREGKGYASETMKTVIGLLDKSGITTIRGYTESHNLAPQKMFKKFGFSQESETAQGITWVRTILATNSTPTVHIKFDFPRLEDKIPAFMAWLQQQQDEGILELVTLPRMGQSLGEPWTNMFVKDSYERGVTRARYDLIGAGYPVPTLEASGGLVASMSTPFHSDRLAAMYLRAFDQLKGITGAMDMQISHILAQGLADGDNPLTLAKKMNYVISGMGEDLGITDSLGRFIPAERRARMLARTEVIRDHAQAQLQEFKVWGAVGVDVVAEFTTAGFNVCPFCQELARQGPYTIEEAMNLIPAHPHCRCCWIPRPVEARR